MNPYNCTEDANHPPPLHTWRNCLLMKCLGQACLSQTSFGIQAFSLESPTPCGFVIPLGTCMHLEELSVSGVGKCPLVLVVLSQMQALSVYPPSAPRPGNIQELRHMGSWFQTLVNAQICSKFFLWKTVFSIV